MTRAEISPPERWRLAWPLLIVVYLLLGFLYSVIQPLAAVPDETANMQYVQWLTTHRSLPPWVPTGMNTAGGGYESQHPPLAFGLYSLPYALTRGLPENWRWQTVRWFALLLGLILVALAIRLSRTLFPARPLPQIAFAATVVLMPLSLLYLCHANPDGIGLILSAAGLLLAWRIHDAPEERPHLPWIGGIVAALAALTKLSVMPVGLVLVAAQWLRPGQVRAERLRRCLVMVVLWIAGAGWWYVRNFIVYGRPFLHTAVANMGPGLTLAARAGVARTAEFTLSETFLSFWAQRGWFPAGWDTALYGLIVLMVLLAAVGWVRGRVAASPSRFIIGVSVFLVLFVLIGQQWAFWMVDMELNAGGRYLLIALPAVAVLLIAGVERLGPRASSIILPLWIVLLVVMNVVSAYNIVDALTPHYFPGWHMFEFATGAPP